MSKTVAGSYARVDATEAEAEGERLRRQAAGVWARERDLLASLGLTAGLRLLDVGCGPAAFLRRVTAEFPPLFAVGVDRDPQHLARARETAPAWRADAAALPAKSGAFDLALMRLVLRHVTDPAAVVAEAVRTVRSGGTVLAVDGDDGAMLLDPEPPGWPRLRDALEATARRRGAEPHLGRRLNRLLLGAGLSDVRTECLPITSGDLGVPALVELFLAPNARPIDADLMTPSEARDHWDAIKTWSARPDAWGLVMGFYASGRRP